MTTANQAFDAVLDTMRQDENEWMRTCEQLEEQIGYARHHGYLKLRATLHVALRSALDQLEALQKHMVTVRNLRDEQCAEWAQQDAVNAPKQP